MQAEENGVSLREAATRVFSNASGSYSSNVNLAVENSSWSDEQQLQEMYLKRKSFAFNSDRSAVLLTLYTILFGLTFQKMQTVYRQAACSISHGVSRGGSLPWESHTHCGVCMERGSGLHRRCNSPLAAFVVRQDRCSHLLLRSCLECCCTALSRCVNTGALF